MSTGDYIFAGCMSLIPFAATAPFWAESAISRVKATYQSVPSRIELVADILQDSGWRSDYRRMYHETGVVIETNYQDKVRAVEVDGVELDLNEASIRLLTKAVAQHKTDTLRSNQDRATREWAKRVAERAQRETVVPFEKRA